MRLSSTMAQIEFFCPLKVITSDYEYSLLRLIMVGAHCMAFYADGHVPPGVKVSKKICVKIAKKGGICDECGEKM